MFGFTRHTLVSFHITKTAYLKTICHAVAMFVFCVCRPKNVWCTSRSAVRSWAHFGVQSLLPSSERCWYCSWWQQAFSTEQRKGWTLAFGVCTLI